MHAVGFTSVALPPTTPSAFSGQARTQVAEPTQRAESTTGCSEAGSFMPADSASASALACRDSVLRRRHT